MSALVIFGVAAALVGFFDAVALALARAASLTDRQSIRLARRLRRRETGARPASLVRLTGPRR